MYVGIMILIVILVTGLLYLFPKMILLFASYYAHKCQVRRYTDRWDYSDFETFLKEFRKREWKIYEEIENSLESKEGDSEIHAGVVNFDGKGMVMKNAWEFRKMEKFIENYYNEKKKGLTSEREVGMWKSS